VGCQLRTLEPNIIANDTANTNMRHDSLSDFVSSDTRPENISDQTGLTFTKELRVDRRLLVEPVE